MRVTLAGPEHDPQLRAMLRQYAMPGWVRLAFEREPDFFAAASTLGSVSQTVVGLDGDTVIGMGCRAVRDVYVNGRAMPLGYLSALRIRQDFRRGTGLARGYRFLRQLHGDGRTAAYLSTIIAGNREAQTLLEAGRAGLPRYRYLGRYLTFAVALGRWRPGRRPRPDATVSTAGPSGLDEVVGFLNACGPRRQFFPVIRGDDFGSPAWRGLDPEHLLTARGRDGRIEGVAACWDQGAYKQTRVVAYNRTLGVTRPIGNVLLRLAGFPQLPAEGCRLRSLSLSLVCVRDDDAGILAALLNEAHAKYRGRLEWMMIGMHERDPLCGAIRRLTALRYASRVYAVCWEDGEPLVDSLDPDRVPYLDVAIL